MIHSKLYPLTLLLIIVGAIYFVVGDLGKPKNVNLPKYQEVCEKYLAAKPGEVSRDELQMMVSNVNYLIPAELGELTDPMERSVKSCAQKLSERLKNTENKN